MSRFSDYAHLFRLAAIGVVVLTCFLLVRAQLVPGDFGEYGHFRTGAIADNRAQPLVFAGRAACADCHSDVIDARKSSRHEPIGCEACHGPLARHASAEDDTKPVRPDPRTTCIRCHDSRAGKPAAFPQVNVADHAPDGACTTCHPAHHPEIQ
jgi:hypothetical protein